MEALKKYNYIFLTFIFSFVVMTIAFANEGLFPFGDKQIMIIDSWHQYYPILQEMHSKMINGQSLFYSWNTGSGSNFYLMIAYYAMSPLNLLSMFFPPEYLREFLLLATILKISLAGAFFSIYIKEIFKKNDLSITFFGILYAFSGYLMGYYWDIMWLDCVALLPLIVLGMHRLMAKRRYLLFVISLTVAIVSNFYIAYFVCEFVAIYFFVLYYTQYYQPGIKCLLKKIGDFALFSILSVGTSFVVLLPTYLGMKRAYGLASGDPTTISTYHSLLDILNNLLANIKPTVIDGLPNIYSGLLTVLLVILYFSLNNVSQKSKIIYFGLLAFFVFSFNINYLNFVWHGFHFPNQVPFRFAFLMSFVMLTIAYETYVHLELLSNRTIWKVTAVLLVYLVIAEKMYKSQLDFKVFYVNMLLLVLYSGFILLFKHSKLSEKAFVLLICYIIIGEALMTSLNATEVAGNSGRADYPAQKNEVQAAFAKLKDIDSDFYRTEMFWNYTVNDPLMYGYKGVSQFSSTANSKFNVFSKKMGISADPGSNSSLFTPSTPVINGLYSIKYVLSKHNAVNLPNASYEIVSEEKDLLTLKNKYYFPFGFMINEAATQLDLEHMSPFTKQESFLSLSIGRDVKIFENVPAISETYDNMERTQLENIRYHYKNVDTSKIGKGKVAFIAPKTGQIYAYMLNQTKTATLTVDGAGKIYETPRGVIMDLGVVKKGTSIDLSFEVPAAATGFFDIQVVLFDETAFSEARDAIIDESFRVMKQSDTHIEGSVKAESDGLLFMSMPYEEGWEVKVDGVKSEAIAYKDAVLTIQIAKGVHTIELNYMPYGFRTGLGVSIISLLLLFVMLNWNRLFRNRNALKNQSRIQS